MTYRESQHPRIPKGHGDVSGEWTATGANAARRLKDDRRMASARAAVKAAQAKAHAERVARAKAAFKPAAQAEQDVGHEGERRLASFFGLKKTDVDEEGKHHTYDLIVPAGHTHRGLSFGGEHHLEVKTLVQNSNQKITIRKAALARKVNYTAKVRGATSHTIVLDSHDNFAIYYKRGVGSFRVGSMIRVRDFAHLHQLITERHKR